MPPWMEVVLVVVCIGLVFHSVGLSDELKLTNSLLELSNNKNTRLLHKLSIAKKEIAELKGEGSDDKKKAYNEPDFLSADDPLEALLKEVGRVRP